MELRNEKGEVTQIADNLTIREVLDMGYSIDLCDQAFDSSEHWHADAMSHKDRGEFPEG